MKKTVAVIPEAVFRAAEKLDMPVENLCRFVREQKVTFEWFSRLPQAERRQYQLRQEALAKWATAKVNKSYVEYLQFQLKCTRTEAMKVEKWALDPKNKPKQDPSRQELLHSVTTWTMPATKIFADYVAKRLKEK